ncbi:MAG: polymorphic outer membrane protein [Geminicoccaceae bacterium]|jgi:hypothetical protein|nr:polymorphic outer membrane protein [Geminicoccaceae bacterium]
MFGSVSRPVRWALTLLAPALGACTDAPTAARPGRASVNSTLSAGEVFTVTNTSGGTDAGSVRWAAKLAGEGDFIRFDPALAGDTITLDSTLILSGVTIEGPKGGGVALSGGGRVKVMHVYEASTVRNLTVTKGYDPAQSGIGGISVSAALRLENSTVSDNSGGLVGGIQGRYLSLINSTVARNTSSGSASGLTYDALTRVELVNSTIAQNGPAPGIKAVGWPRLNPIEFRNSIIANNGAPRRNCNNLEGVTYVGTIIADDTTCGGYNVVLVADPKLGTFANHGGPAATLDFAYDSPALNAGSTCSVTVDQRYVPRDTKCDAGAFEFTEFTTVTLTIDPNASVGTNGSAVVTGTVTCSRGGDQFGVVVEVQQQKSGKTPSTVQGDGGLGVTCTTSPQPWSIPVTPSAGAFDTGNATAKARTNDTSGWITPASTSRTIKLLRSRR